MVRMQTLAQEILESSTTGGKDNHLLHPLFLILLFKHLLPATACNMTLGWMDLKLHCIYHGVRKYSRAVTVSMLPNHILQFVLLFKVRVNFLSMK